MSVSYCIVCAGRKQPEPRCSLCQSPAPVSPATTTTQCHRCKTSIFNLKTAETMSFTCIQCLNEGCNDVGWQADCDRCMGRTVTPRARIPSVLFVPAVLLLIGCTTRPLSMPSPGRPPRLAWEACPGRVYFVNYAPFSVPDIYIVIAGPLLYTGPEMIWQTEEQGLYCVGAETIP